MYDRIKKQLATRVHFPGYRLNCGKKKEQVLIHRVRTHSDAGIWRICFSSLRYAHNPLCLHHTYFRSTHTRMHDRSGDADRPRLVRRNEIKIGVSRSRVLQTGPGENTSNSDCGEIPDRTEESWKRTPPSKGNSANSGIAAAIPGAKSALFRGGRKLNNSLSRKFLGMSRRCHRRNRKTTGRYIYSDDEGSRWYLTEFDRLVCGTSIYLKISIAKFVINPDHSRSV